MTAPATTGDPAVGLSPSTITIEANPLNAEDIVAIARGRAPLALGDVALDRIAAGRNVVENHVTAGAAVYGLNTGLGASVDTPLEGEEEVVAFSQRVAHSHSVGMGPILPRDTVRAMMAARVSSMAAGGSGVSPHVAVRLVEALNTGFHPLVPAWGSIGAADLSPLAHVARALVGSGWAEVGGAVHPAAEALALAGLSPLQIGAKDGHALVVANSLSVGSACLCLDDVARVVEWSLRAIALDYEAFRANLTVLDESALGARPAFGQVFVGSQLRELLAGSELWNSGAARRLQDPLSYRCVPQVWGALVHAVAETAEITHIELGSSGDNPVVLAGENRIVPQGNFDLTAFALSWERLGQALAHCAASAANRAMRLMSPAASELPRFLSPRGQSRAGYALLQKSLSSLEAEIRHLANPISLSPLAVADGIEDVASMSPRIVHKTGEIVDRFRYLVAIELMTAATGVELRGCTEVLGRGARETYDDIRRFVAVLDEDRELTSDLYALTNHIKTESPGGAPIPTPEDL